nr:hypothetical protein [uncultured Acetatifactor sp.]
MGIKTFSGIVECVDRWVNEFAEGVDVRDIQTHATGKDTMMASVVYEEGAGDGRE